MDPTLLVAIVSLVVTSVLAMASLAANLWMWRRSRPNQRLSIFTRSFALLAERATSFESGVSVLYKETEVKDPFVVEVLISSEGRNDIPSMAFDDGKPMIINFTTQVLAEVSPQKGLQLSTDRRSIFLSPRLLRRGESIGGAFLCEGRPDVRKPEVPLVDVEVDFIDGNEQPIVVGKIVDPNYLQNDKKGLTLALGAGLMISSVLILITTMSAALSLIP